MNSTDSFFCSGSAFDSSALVTAIGCVLAVFWYCVGFKIEKTEKTMTMRMWEQGGRKVGRERGGRGVGRRERGREPKKSWC